jgi:hypothetical protein
VVALLAVGSPAFADDKEPWATGVSDDRKVAAKTLLEQGNTQFVGKDYKAALATYETAIASWDHPAIRFNIVRTLIQLDRPLEAAEQLELALKYGAAPLEEAVYSEALSYQKLLAGQIAEISIKCDQPGVDVTLDGKSLGKCPLVVARRIQPGQHQLVGRLAGFQTRTLDMILLGGKRQDVALALERGETPVVLVHRWPTWVPWVVFAGGFAVGGIGVLLDLKAASDMASYDRAINAGCIGMACPPRSQDPDSPVDDKLKDRATLESRIAIGIMTVSAATVAVGAALLYLNRGKRVSKERAQPTKTVRLDAARGGATVGLSGRF